MKNIKLNAAKVLVSIAILCPAVFADGEMGSGGFVGTNPMVPPATTKPQLQLEEGEMGSGGRTAQTTSSVDSFWNTIYEYFDAMI